MRWREMGGGSGVVRMRWRWCGGAVFGRTSGGGRFGAKCLKPSHWGSVSGTLLEMALEGDGERWRGGVYEMAVVWWCRVWSPKRGRWVWDTNPKTEPPGLGFGCAVVN